MKLLPWLAVALFAGGCPKHTDTVTAPPTQTADAEVVTLTLAPPVVGSVDTKHSTKISDLDITMQGEHLPMHIEEEMVEHVEYREVTDVPQQLLVTYEADHKATTFRGETKTEASPLERHAYLVWKDGGTIQASRDGAAVEPEELEGLDNRFADEIGQFPGVARVLTGRRWTVDQAYTLGPDDLVVMAEGKDGKATAGTFTLLGQEGGNAIFDLRLTVAMDTDKVEGTLESHMRATIQISPARPVEIIGDGTIEASAGGLPFTGTMHVTETYSHELAP